MASSRIVRKICTIMAMTTKHINNYVFRLQILQLYTNFTHAMEWQSVLSVYLHKRYYLYKYW